MFKPVFKPKSKMKATISVICYKSKTLANGEHPLMLRITQNRKSSYFKVIDNMFVEIQRFREAPITSVYSNNPLPLPYLYNHLDNNK